MNFTILYSNRGSAMLLTLGAVSIMSVAVLGLAEFSSLDLAESASQERRFRALQLAESGIALGEHPQISSGDPILEQKIGPSEMYSVKVKSEGARLNLNAVLLGKDQKPLNDLLTQWGVSSKDRSRIVDCLMDWVDSDSLRRLNGAEQNDYEAQGKIGYPPNRPFQNLDEVAGVPGMDIVAKVKPNWRDSFTVLGDGKLDLNEASAELIEALCGVGSVSAESFVRRRLGPDGKINTIDDFIYQDLNQARIALGLSVEAFNLIEPLVTLKSPYRRIESTGRVGTCEHRIAVVIQLNAKPVQYLSWTEY